MNRRDWTLIAIAVTAYVALAFGSVATKSMTSDEGAHVVAGYAYWRLDDFRLQPENGNWPQRWLALPLAFGGVDEDVTSMAGWKASDIWNVSDTFLYDSGHDADSLLRRGRFMAALVGAATALLTFWWARSLFGPAASWVALLVFIFSPTTLAHGPLATSDMMAAFFFTASAWAIWRSLHRVDVRSVLTTALCVAGALLSKFSAPILVPIALVLIAIRVAAAPPMRIAWRGRSWTITARSRLAAVSAALLAANAVIAIAVVWMSYGFRYAAMSPSAAPAEFLVQWSTLLGELGWMADVVNWARDHHALPEAYLYGFTQTAYYAKHRVAFFNGQASDVGGWVGFFPYATMVKETIPVLILAAWAAVHLVRKRTYDLWPLVTLIAVYWAFALATNLNIGYRHLLPTLPASYALIGALAAHRVWPAWRERSRRMIPVAALAALLAWHAGESLIAAPNFIAYFNELAGGSRRGYEHLVDSSLDWGQDLPTLKRWLDRNGLQDRGHEPVYLSYFGNARPSYYGIDAVMLPGYPDRRPRAIPGRLTAGVYCISATMYQGIYLDVPRSWPAEYQRNYEGLVANMRLFDSTAANPADRARLIRQTGEDFWWRSFSTFEQFRLARLVAYLRRRAPDANAGYSILIFRLTDADIRAALATNWTP